MTDIYDKCGGYEFKISVTNVEFIKMYLTNLPI